MIRALTILALIPVLFAGTLPDAPAIRLKDHHGKETLVIPADAGPRVLLYSDREGSRDSSPVLLDWHGEIARVLGFDFAVPNLYLFDAAGRHCGHLAGRADEETRQQLRRLMSLCAERPPT